MKRFVTWPTTLAVVLSICLSVLAPAPHAAAQELTNGNNSLGRSGLYTLTGDVVVAGVGLRNVGFGTIFLDEVPSGATVHRAYLYWATLGTSNTYTQVSLNGQPASGQLIGTTGDTCWGVQNNFVYRADVTALVGGNGRYLVSGLPDDLLEGNNSQGASLVVIYRQASAPLRTIVINDGAVALNFTRTSHTTTISGYLPTNPVGDAHITYLVGDGQEDWDAGSVTFNGEPIAGGVFSGVDGPYWGSHTFDVTSLMTGSSATTTITNQDDDPDTQPDCILWAAAIFSVTAAAPQTTNQMEESYRYTLTGDVTAAGVGLRGTGQGTINLSGLPDNHFVQAAFLYWATLGSFDAYTRPLLNGTAVDGVKIGTSADTCWGAPASYVYRADVTGWVRASGNSDYTISGLPNDLESGNDSQGASLVVVYFAAGLYRTVIINDGAVTLDLVTNTFTDNIGPFTADQPNAQAHITYLVGDGQSEWDSGSILFEGQQIAGSVFNGVDGEHWGTLRFNVSGMLTEPDATTTLRNDTPAGPNSPDCLVWAASVLSLETEPLVYDYFYFAPTIAR